MSAETGVGPAIASGSHVYSGICALFPVHPRKKKRQIQVTRFGDSVAVRARIDSNSSVPRFANSMNIAIRKPKSPMRLTMKAFFPASAFAFSENQKPMSR